MPLKKNPAGKPGKNPTSEATPAKLRAEATSSGDSALKPGSTAKKASGGKTRPSAKNLKPRRGDSHPQEKTGKKPPRSRLFDRFFADDWYRHFLEYFFVGTLILCVGVLTKRLGQADIIGDQGLGSSLKSVLPIADILYYVGAAMESYFPLMVAFMLAFAAAKRPNAAVALAVLSGWSGYIGATTALSQYSTGATSGAIAGIDLGLFGGVLVGFLSAACWSTFRFRRVTTWARMVSGIPLVIIITATAGVILGILTGVVYQLLYLVVVLGLGALFKTAPEPVAAAIYGFLHPLAEVTGWGSLLDITPFKLYGSCQTPSGDTLNGSYTCFIYGGSQIEGQQALFLAGGYPVVGFGLTALFLVLWFQLRGENRQYWKILYWLVILSTFLAGAEKVGIFMLVFSAPVLLLAHMVASALSYAITAVLAITVGWAGGPGLIDLLRWQKSGTGAILLVILGIFFAAIYVIMGMLIMGRRGKKISLPGFGVPYITKPFMGIPTPVGKHGKNAGSEGEKPAKDAAIHAADNESDARGKGSADLDNAGPNNVSKEIRGSYRDEIKAEETGKDAVGDKTSPEVANVSAEPEPSADIPTQPATTTATEQEFASQLADAPQMPTGGEPEPREPVPSEPQLSEPVSSEPNPVYPEVTYPDYQGGFAGEPADYSAGYQADYYPQPVYPPQSYQSPTTYPPEGYGADGYSQVDYSQNGYLQQYGEPGVEQPYAPQPYQEASSAPDAVYPEGPEAQYPVEAQSAEESAAQYPNGAPRPGMPGYPAGYPYPPQGYPYQ